MTAQLSAAATPQAIHRDMPIISLTQDRRPWP
jgi:hypothetical protein